LLATLRENFRTDLHEIFRKVGNGPMNNWLNFGGDPDHRLGTGIVFRGYGKWLTDIHTDSPDWSTGKM